MCPLIAGHVRADAPGHANDCPGPRGRDWPPRRRPGAGYRRFPRQPSRRAPEARRHLAGRPGRAGGGGGGLLPRQLLLGAARRRLVPLPLAPPRLGARSARGVPSRIVALPPGKYRHWRPRRRRRRRSAASGTTGTTCTTRATESTRAAAGTTERRRPSLRGAVGPSRDPGRPFAYGTRVARTARALVGNAPGDLFVDDTCIACDTCRALAPETFGGGEDERAFVSRQPGEPAERRRALLALVACPVAAIGSRSKAGVGEAARAFPSPFAPGVLAAATPPRRRSARRRGSSGGRTGTSSWTRRGSRRRCSRVSARSAVRASCSSRTATTSPTTRAGARPWGASACCTRATSPAGRGTSSGGSRATRRSRSGPASSRCPSRATPRARARSSSTRPTCSPATTCGATPRGGSGRRVRSAGGTGRRSARRWSGSRRWPFEWALPGHGRPWRARVRRGVPPGGPRARPGHARRLSARAGHSPKCAGLIPFHAQYARSSRFTSPHVRATASRSSVKPSGTRKSGMRSTGVTT